jgi:single-strand DNA-binding protein
MYDLNQVTLTGRLTRDLEVKAVKDTVLATGSLAVNRTVKDVEYTTFVDFEIWDKAAETLAKYSEKGKQLLVVGRLKSDSWEKDGQKRSKLLLVVEDFKFLGTGVKSE